LNSIPNRLLRHWWAWAVSKIIELGIATDKRNQFIDITHVVQKAIDDSGAKEGTVEVFVPHTTAAVTINENADPDVKSDILAYLERLIPKNSGFRHSEGNSDAHIKSSLVGVHIAVFISDGRLMLGTWQGIYFCEFDGPRSRHFFIKIIFD
jgi:secondary thiamine-phosphate synthase enzyme